MKVFATVLLLAIASLLFVVVKSEDDFPTPMPLKTLLRAKRQFVVGGYPGYGGYGGYPYGYGGYGVVPYGGYWG